MPKRIGFKKPKHRKPTRIREMRESRGLSQDALGELIGTSGASISRIETGEQPYTQDTLEAVADALKTDVASLLKRQSEDTDAILLMLERAKPSDRRKFLDIARTITSEPDLE